MISKGRKMLAVGVVLGLCAVAMIGAAYAAFGGTAKTYNEGNSASTEYMTLTPNGDNTAQWSAISANGTALLSTYVFNHNTAVAPADPVYQTTKAYYMTGVTPIDLDGGEANDYVVKSVGIAKAYTVSNQTGDSISKLTLNVKAKIGTSGALGTGTDFKYFVSVTIGSTTIYKEISTTGEDYAFTGLSIADESSSTTITVDILYGYDPNCAIPDDGIGDVVASSTTDYAQEAIMTTEVPADMANISLAFTLSNPA